MTLNALPTKALADGTEAQGILRHDKALYAQAVNLRKFLPENFKYLLSQIKKSPENLAATLLPSSDFDVAMAALGSGVGDPERVKARSLEDLFTTNHQTLITLSRSMGSRSGVQVQHLPKEVQTLCKAVCENIKLNTFDKDAQHHPTLQQSITYTYPTTRISFNCPLYNHSAQWHIDVRIDATGKIENIEFEGDFYAKGTGKAPGIFAFALGLYYPSFGRMTMQAPPGYKIVEQHTGAVKFRWQLFPVSGNAEQYWWEGQRHLQSIIDTLQGRFSQYTTLPDNLEFFRDFPEAVEFHDFTNHSMSIKPEEIVEVVGESLLKKITPDNLSAFLIVYHKGLFTNQKLLDRIIEKMLDDPDIINKIWPTRVPTFFVSLNSIEGLITPERRKKLALLIPKLPKDEAISVEFTRIFGS